LRETVKTSYEQMDAARSRLLELLHHQLHQQTYRKRTAIALEIVQQLEQEGHFP
jgi:DNA-directed RNA polymerase specialized sigma54-like protein